ncbi:MAG: hypothetical protein R3F49_06000 [Planctomycetota bacterium]
MSSKTIEKHISAQSAPALADLVDKIAALFAANYEIESVEVTEDEGGLPVMRFVLVR